MSIFEIGTLYARVPSSSIQRRSIGALPGSEAEVANEVDDHIYQGQLIRTHPIAFYAPFGTEDRYRSTVEGRRIPGDPPVIGADVGEFCSAWRLEHGEAIAGRDRITIFWAGS